MQGSADRERFRGLDGLRAVSIALVMLAHSRAAPGFPPWLGPIAGRGPFGVSIFFVLSGFLITCLLLREETAAHKVDLARFYARRALRILPPAYALLVLATVWAQLHGKAVSAQELSACAFFYRNLVHGSEYLGHFWSLAVEEQFYLFWPVFIAFAAPRWRLPSAVALVAVLPVWRWANYRMFGMGHFNILRTVLVYDGLLIGAVLAMVRTDTRFRGLLDGLSARRRAIAPACVGLIVLIQCSIALQMPKYGSLGLSACEVLVAVLIHVLSGGDAGPVSNILDSRPMVWLGRISYSVYLWQQIFLTNETGSWLERLPQALLGGICAGALSYQFIERPVQELRSKWRLGHADGLGVTGGSHSVRSPEDAPHVPRLS
jgi:peptidoglycan/LPS O-acetylase OafA/YrhL